MSFLFSLYSKASFPEQLLYGRLCCVDGPSPNNLDLLNRDFLRWFEDSPQTVLFAMRKTGLKSFIYILYKWAFFKKKFVPLEITAILCLQKKSNKFIQ